MRYPLFEVVSIDIGQADRIRMRLFLELFASPAQTWNGGQVACIVRVIRSSITHLIQTTDVHRLYLSTKPSTGTTTYRRYKSLLMHTNFAIPVNMAQLVEACLVRYLTEDEPGPPTNPFVQWGVLPMHALMRASRSSMGSTPARWPAVIWSAVIWSAVTQADGRQQGGRRETERH